MEERDCEVMTKASASFKRSASSLARSLSRLATGGAGGASAAALEAVAEVEAEKAAKGEHSGSPKAASSDDLEGSDAAKA